MGLVRCVGGRAGGTITSVARALTPSTARDAPQTPRHNDETHVAINPVSAILPPCPRRQLRPSATATPCVPDTAALRRLVGRGVGRDLQASNVVLGHGIRACSMHG